jgi:5'-nucleotidase (lipoprotein e(P4) family)
MLAQQLPVLDAWIESMEARRQPYMVLGDFNHRLSAPYNRFTRDITTLKNGEKASLRNLSASLIGCHPRYPAPIDHIFAGHLPASTEVTQVQAHHYADMSDKGMLSDHCAVSATLRSATAELSSAVRWQTQSKEYGVITEYLYQQAMTTITARNDYPADWVVVMDLDETVLDNSAYQVMLDRSGMRYQKATWDDWVRAEQAKLVPGAATFIAQVLQAGGRLALITNRDKALDAHTWRNLQALSLPLNASNTCLLAKSGEDRQLSPADGLVNDKDRRRQAIREGNAACYVSSSQTLDAAWRKPHEIVMQVGDNIEDLAGTTQENAVPAILLPRVGKDIVLLPNPMYGSW